MSRSIKPGSTNQTVYFMLRDSSDGTAKTGLVFDSAGVIGSFTRALAARVAITLVTQTVTGAHTDGGFVEVDATNQKGLYRLDLPDAAVATGVPIVSIGLQFTGVFTEQLEIVLGQPVDVALINGVAAAAVDLQDFATNGYDSDNNRVFADLVAINADTTAADVLKAIMDGGTKGTVSDVGATSTDFDTDLTEASNDHYNTMLMVFTNGALKGQGRFVVDYIGASKNMNFAGQLWTEAPGDGDAFILLPIFAGSDLKAIKGNAGKAADFSDAIQSGILKANIDEIKTNGSTPDDLNDFINNGYDTATKKVEGVKLVDTTTVNSDMRGTDSAATAANLATMQADVDAILVDTADMQPRIVAIEVDTDTTIPALIAGLNDLSAAQVNAEVDTALADINLDHLMKVAVTGADVIDDSVIAQIVSKAATADWDTFDNVTDSLEAIADMGAGTTDWSSAEREQIRDSLGVDGTKTASTGGKVQDILTDTAETQGKLPTNNIMGSSVKTDKDDEIDAILVDTGTTIPAQISGLNNLSAAQVNAEVDTALADIDLDHLTKVGAAPTVTAGSNLDQIMNKDGGQTFSQATDSLEAARDFQSSLRLALAANHFYFDSTNGNDAAGVDGSKDNPFKTASKVASTYKAGDIMHIVDTATTQTDGNTNFANGFITVNHDSNDDLDTQWDATGADSYLWKFLDGCHLINVKATESHASKPDIIFDGSLGIENFFAENCNISRIQLDDPVFFFANSIQIIDSEINTMDWNSALANGIKISGGSIQNGVGGFTGVNTNIQNTNVAIPGQVTFGQFYGFNTGFVKGLDLRGTGLRGSISNCTFDEDFFGGCDGTLDSLLVVNSHFEKNVDTGRPAAVDLATNIGIGCTIKGNATIRGTNSFNAKTVQGNIVVSAEATGVILFETRVRGTITVTPGATNTFYDWIVHNGLTDAEGTSKPGPNVYDWDDAPPGNDWNATEKANIRKSLGVDGTKTPGGVAGDVQDILTDTADMQPRVVAIEVDTAEMQPKLPTNNIMGSGVKTDKDDEIDAIKAKTDNLPVDPASETNVNANETKIDAVKVDTAAILADTAEMQPKLPINNIMGSAVKTDKDDEIDAIKAKTDNLPADPASDTNVNANETKIDAVKVDTAAILADTAEMQPKLPTNNIMGSAVKTDKDDEIDAIKAKTDQMAFTAGNVHSHKKASDGLSAQEKTDAENAVHNAPRASHVASGTMGELQMLIFSGTVSKYRIFNDTGDGQKLKAQLFNYAGVIAKTIDVMLSDNTTPNTTGLNANAMAGRKSVL